MSMMIIMAVQSWHENVGRARSVGGAMLTWRTRSAHAQASAWYSCAGCADHARRKPSDKACCNTRAMKSSPRGASGFGFSTAAVFVAEGDEGTVIADDVAVADDAAIQVA